MLSKSNNLRTSVSVGAAILAALVLPSPAQAQIRCDTNGVVLPGYPGTNTFQCGSINNGAPPSDNLTAVGLQLTIIGDNVTAVGMQAVGSTSGDFSAFFSPSDLPGATALGAFSIAAGFGSVAIGDQAIVANATIDSGLLDIGAAVNFGTAVGSFSTVSADAGTAIGAFARVSGGEAVAVGLFSQASQFGAVAIGTETDVIAAYSTAVGYNADVSSTQAIALGAGTNATATGAVAIGGDADGNGVGAQSTGTGAIAIGADSSAAAANSVALGAGSVANQANTVSVGSDLNQRRIVNVAAGTAATDAVNVGQLNAVTGNVIGLQTTVSTQTMQITNLQTRLGDTNADVAVLQSDLASETSARIAADTAFDTRVDALETITANLDQRFDDVQDRSDAGTAAAVALSGAMFLPSKSFNLTGNVGAYRGAVAGAIQFGALVSDMVAVNAGVAHGFNKGGKTAVRAGFTLGW